MGVQGKVCKALLIASVACFFMVASCWLSGFVHHAWSTLLFYDWSCSAVQASAQTFHNVVLACSKHNLLSMQQANEDMGMLCPL